MKNEEEEETEEAEEEDRKIYFPYPKTRLGIWKSPGDERREKVSMPAAPGGT